MLGLCLVLFAACGEKPVAGNPGRAPASSHIEKTTESESAASSDAEEEEDGENPAESQEETGSAPEQVASSEDPPTEADEELVDGLRPEFKEEMDSYEAFYDEYCEFLKKYDENPSDFTLLAKYAEMMAKAAEMTEKFDAWEADDLNTEELKYYLDVNNRVAKKLLEVTE